MAGKRKDPGQRRAREAMRRVAAAERIGPRPKRTPRQRKLVLYALKPPGAFYREWDRLAVPQGMAGVSPLKAVETQFGADSGVVDTMKTMMRYSDIYGVQIPTAAATHLDTLARLSGMAAELASDNGITEDEAVEQLHILHAAGFLLIDDDGSVWLTVPPGTPESAPDGGWTFMEKRLDASQEVGTGRRQ
ncbi:hypothetical protein CF54_40095 [Streptomyces sp. Tu 6176]|uniref:hypothetical protein n=1 Tax=Streptomyces sp. Tu 6176 TaxID=1470557 RepID=UPI000448A1E1|nr:hypothetical protein [Streptomyces sp. Tu 6176]EYT77951.1 hypothetical protein CF54_40095 [Streptomyces sp. Tu 6176]